MSGGARVAAVAAVAVLAFVPEARAGAVDYVAKLAGSSSSGSSAAGVKAGKFAERQQGRPYVFGADGPAAYDCSGLVIRAWKSAGADWPDSTADELGRHWPRVPLRAAQPGDLLAFDWGPGSRVAGFDHVAIVTAGGRFVEAPMPGVPVRIRRLAGVHPSAVVRPDTTW